MNHLPSALGRYGLAIAATGGALVFMLLMDPALHLNQASFLLFFGAVTLSAFYGGVKPGIVSTLFASLAANYFFLAPQFTWTFGYASNMRMLLFAIQGVVISALVGNIRVVQEQTRCSLQQVQASEAEIQTLNQALQRRVDELQTLFEVIPVNIAIAEDPACKQVKLNPAFVKLLRIPADENASLTPPTGRPLPPFRMYQNGRELRGEEMPQQYAAKYGVELRDLEIEIVHEDGAVFNLYGCAAPLFDETRQPRGSVVAFVDISERKQMEEALRLSENRFRLATHAVVGIVYDWDVKTGEVFRSEGLYDLIGVPADTAPVDRHWWTARVHPEDLEKVRRDMAAILASGDRYAYEYRVRHEAGHWIDVWDRGYLIRDGEGQLIRVVGSTTDISDRKRAEQEREAALERERAARQEAETANQLKDEFLAVLSHELRSPLNPILGWSSLLRTKKLSAEKTAYALETIERNAKLQTQLIEDLLDVSRILRGKLSLNTMPVDLNAVIEAALETVKLAAEAKSISLRVTLDAEIGQVLGDAARLQQVVWNLLSNAVKFTPPAGQVAIALTTVAGSQGPGALAQITVTDTGRGISPDFLPYLFEYFRQADASTTRKFGGLGLGLAIVRHLVELHGGTVYAESPGADQGATFTVQLPLLQSGGTIEKETSLEGDRAVSSPRPLDQVTVLVVEDDADTRNLISFILSEAGGQVILAQSASEALEQFRLQTPTVVVSDIGMPDMNGYALLRHIRTLSAEQGSQTPAIALTAYASESDQHQASTAGFQTHLAKPVDPEALIQAILALL
jgi:PAS domain S-box-containing protein